MSMTTAETTKESLMKKPRLNHLQIITHIAGWLPQARIAVDYFTHNLTANPIQAIEQRTGTQALIFLVLSLACTPAASIFGWKELTQRRKALGNYGFLYAALHVFTFFAIDYGLDLSAIWIDVRYKPYIIIGATAFMLLVPLAVTSFRYWMKRLGKNWKRLHRLVYIISPLVVLHFSLAVKADLTQPLLYGSIVLILLILRIPKLKMALIGWRKQSRALQKAPRGLVNPQKQK
jgi:methionine sulfoxide reductase heme-binding subunit